MLSASVFTLLVIIIIVVTTTFAFSQTTNLAVPSSGDVPINDMQTTRAIRADANAQRYFNLAVALENHDGCVLFTTRDGPFPSYVVRCILPSTNDHYTTLSHLYHSMTGASVSEFTTAVFAHPHFVVLTTGKTDKTTVLLSVVKGTSPVEVAKAPFPEKSENHRASVFHRSTSMVFFALAMGTGKVEKYFVDSVKRNISFVGQVSGGFGHTSFRAITLIEFHHVLSFDSGPIEVQNILVVGSYASPAKLVTFDADNLTLLSHAAAISPNRSDLNRTTHVFTTSHRDFQRPEIGVVVYSLAEYTTNFLKWNVRGKYGVDFLGAIEAPAAALRSSPRPAISCVTQFPNTNSLTRVNPFVFIGLSSGLIVALNVTPTDVNGNDEFMETTSRYDPRFVAERQGFAPSFVLAMAGVYPNRMLYAATSEAANPYVAIMNFSWDLRIRSTKDDQRTRTKSHSAGVQTPPPTTSTTETATESATTPSTTTTTFMLTEVATTTTTTLAHQTSTTSPIVSTAVTPTSTPLSSSSSSSLSDSSTSSSPINSVSTITTATSAAATNSNSSLSPSSFSPAFVPPPPTNTTTPSSSSRSPPPHSQPPLPPPSLPGKLSDQTFKASSATANVVAGIASATGGAPAAAMTAGRALALTQLVGCSATNQNGEGWLEASFSFPSTFLPSALGFGPSVGYHVRAALASLVGIVFLVFIGAIIVAIIRQHMLVEGNSSSFASPSSSSSSMSNDGNNHLTYLFISRVMVFAIAQTVNQIGETAGLLLGSLSATTEDFVLALAPLLILLLLAILVIYSIYINVFFFPASGEGTCSATKNAQFFLPNHVERLVGNDKDQDHSHHHHQIVRTPDRNSNEKANNINNSNSNRNSVDENYSCFQKIVDHPTWGPFFVTGSYCWYNPSHHPLWAVVHKFYGPIQHPQQQEPSIRDRIRGKLCPYSLVVFATATLLASLLSGVAKANPKNLCPAMLTLTAVVNSLVFLFDLLLFPVLIVPCRGWINATVDGITAVMSIVTAASLSTREDAIKNEGLSQLVSIGSIAVVIVGCVLLFAASAGAFIVLKLAKVQIAPDEQSLLWAKMEMSKRVELRQEEPSSRHQNERRKKGKSQQNNDNSRKSFEQSKIDLVDKKTKGATRQNLHSSSNSSSSRRSGSRKYRPPATSNDDDDDDDGDDEENHHQMIEMTEEVRIENSPSPSSVSFTRKSTVQDIVVRMRQEMLKNIEKRKQRGDFFDDDDEREDEQNLLLSLMGRSPLLSPSSSSSASPRKEEKTRNHRPSLTRSAASKNDTKNEKTESSDKNKTTSPTTAAVSTWSKHHHRHHHKNQHDPNYPLL